MEFHGNWPAEVKEQFIRDMTFIENFISEEEEASLLQELEPYLKRFDFFLIESFWWILDDFNSHFRLHYERDHWDDAIAVYRETERKQWYPKNKEIIERLVKRAFPDTAQILPHVHVLDLAEDGYIKAHVDSVRYCGDTIAGICLLSDAVMKLVQHIDDGSGSTDDYRTRPDANQNKDDLYSASILVKRLGLYIMSHSSRYNFTHEILKNEESIFKGQKIHKTRRISVICRDEPE